MGKWTKKWKIRIPVEETETIWINMERRKADKPIRNIVGGIPIKASLKEDILTNKIKLVLFVTSETLQTTFHILVCCF